MSEDTTIGAPEAGATGGGVEPEDDSVVTVYTHNGEEWVPTRLAPGENTVVRMAGGRPAAVVEVDEESEIHPDLEDYDTVYNVTD